jgi:HSP20 family molecular chaperone IbpA
MNENILKPCACADVKICADPNVEGLIISAELPGVKKNDVKLNFRSGDFCVSGEREDLRFDCCYQLPCEVEYKKSDAKFENGMLTVKVPIAESLLGENINIH